MPYHNNKTMINPDIDYFRQIMTSDELVASHEDDPTFFKRVGPAIITLTGNKVNVNGIEFDDETIVHTQEAETVEMTDCKFAGLITDYGKIVDVSKSSVRYVHGQDIEKLNVQGATALIELETPLVQTLLRGGTNPELNLNGATPIEDIKEYVVKEKPNFKDNFGLDTPPAAMPKPPVPTPPKK